MHSHLLVTFANAISMGKILASAPATMPIRIEPEDRISCTITEELSKAIRCNAPTITRIKLSDKIHSVEFLVKARLRCLKNISASSMAGLT